MQLGQIGSATSSIQGIQDAIATHAARGQRIAQPDGGPQFEQDMAELPSDPDRVAANAKVVKIRDQMLGALIDMLG